MSATVTLIDRAHVAAVPRGPAHGFDRLRFATDAGPVAVHVATPAPGDTDVRIGFIGRPEDVASYDDMEDSALAQLNTMGPRLMLALFRALGDAYPDIETASGYRANGAHAVQWGEGCFQLRRGATARQHVAA